MNTYEKAIHKGETNKFLLGQDEYFHLERDWGIHDSSYTALEMLEYARIQGEESLYRQLDKDLSIALSNEDISVVDFLNLINYIWNYFYYKEKGDYKKDWFISELVKLQIKEQIRIKANQHQDLSIIYDKLNLLKDRFGLCLING